jgi:OmpA-OmpF porin, OOP family
VRVVSGLVLALALIPTASADQRIVYQLYFDHASTKVDKTAGDVIVKVLPQIQKCEANGVRVVGHADASRPDAESSVIATERARSVRNFLLSRGVRDSVVAWVGHSKADLAVPTADGVKEPKNNRAEIILVCDG